MPECGVCYEEYKNLKKLYACSHEICNQCYPKIIEACNKIGSEPSCPFCRTLIKEVTEDFEAEYWLNLEPAEWNIYSYTTNNGTEIIRSYRKYERQPSWRNEDNVMIIKQHKRRKRYRKNKNRN